MTDDDAPTADRLALLRELDLRHHWHSLDDKRVCARCGQIISGREIKITIGTDGRSTGTCPTEGCSGTAEAWSYYSASAEPGTSSEFSFL